MFKLISSTYIAIILMVLPAQMAAQPAKLIIKDKTTNLPLENVIFISNDTKGYSNQSGEILINYNENANLTLTHLSYSTLVLNGKDLLNAIKNGFVEMEYSSPIMLNPVSVYALKEKKPSKAVRLGKC